MKFCTSLLIGTLVVCLSAAGQDAQGKLSESEIALLRADIKTKKTDILRQNLTLSDEQAKTFWPLQRSYENDLSKLGDQRLEVIREYAMNWDKLTDETAENLGKRLLDYQKKRVNLRSRYFDRMSKQLAPTIAAKFFQVETQLENILDLEIASSVPLIR